MKSQRYFDARVELASVLLARDKFDEAKQECHAMLVDCHKFLPATDAPYVAGQEVAGEIAEKQGRMKDAEMFYGAAVSGFDVLSNDAACYDKKLVNSIQRYITMAKKRGATDGELAKLQKQSDEFQEQIESRSKIDSPTGGDTDLPTSKEVSAGE